MKVKSVPKEVFRLITKGYCIDIDDNDRFFRAPSPNGRFFDLCSFVFFCGLSLVPFFELRNYNLFLRLVPIICGILICRATVYINHIVRKDDVWKSEKRPIFKSSIIEAIRGIILGYCKDCSNNRVFLSYRKIFYQIKKYELTSIILETPLLILGSIVFHIRIYVIIKIIIIIFVVITYLIVDAIIKIRSDDSMWIKKAE